jgi:hypothetical protein
VNRKLHKVCRLYGPLPAVRPAKFVPAGVVPIVGPPAEQAKKEFTDENWRDGCGASQARRPKRRHIGTVSAIAGAAFDAATTPAARKHLGKQALVPPMRVPSANWASPANYFWAASLDQWKLFWRGGSEKCAAPARRGRRLCRNTTASGPRRTCESNWRWSELRSACVPTGAVSW